MTFLRWLRAHADDDTPVGDLAGDVAADACWPDSDRFADLVEHLRHHQASEGARRALDKAWSMYRAELADTEDRESFEQHDREEAGELRTVSHSEARQRLLSAASSGEPKKRWRVREERVVDESRRVKLSIVRVELPDGHGYEQYVLRLPRAAMALVVDRRERVLLIRHHRFVVDRWSWEVPGGYVQAGEADDVAAARELLEETGWQAHSLERLVAYQPMTGMADHPCTVFLAENAEQVSAERDPNEAEVLEWIDLDEALQMVERGEIFGAASVAGLLALKVRLLTRAG